MNLVGLEARLSKQSSERAGQRVLIVEILGAMSEPKAIVLCEDSKLRRVPLNWLDVLWHHDEKKGWVADFQADEP